MENKKNIKERPISNINKRWLKLLQQAVDEGVKIQFNHRFKYREKNLGTFLVNAKQNKDKNILDEIKKMGIDLRLYNRTPNDTAYRLILDLKNKKHLKKTNFITRFNQYVLPKKDILPKKLKDEINKAWKERFDEERSWEMPLNISGRISKWKKIRYDRKLNPEKKWFLPRSKSGDMYYWIYARKRKPRLMKRILNYFDYTELLELQHEGFIKDKWIEKYDNML